MNTLVKNILDAIYEPELTQRDFKVFGEHSVTLNDRRFIPFIAQSLDTSSLVIHEDQGQKIYHEKLNVSTPKTWCIIPEIVSKESVNRPALIKEGTDTYKATEWIVVHDTGDITYNAKEWSHICNTDHREVSWHFMVGDTETYQNIPLEEVAWHAGDGGRTPDDIYFNRTYGSWAIGGGNKNGIGIESVVEPRTNYNQVMRNLAELVASLMKLYDLDITHVKQHNNFSGKNCPQAMRTSGDWPHFIKMVETYRAFLDLPEDITLSFKSLTPAILSDNGDVLVDVSKPTPVTYEVTVKGQDKVESLQYTTMILPKAMPQA